MNRFPRGLVVFATFACAFAHDRAAHAADGVASGHEAVGYSVGNDLQLHALGWTEAQFEAFVAGLRASFRGREISADKATHEEFAALTKHINEVRMRAPGNVTAPAGDMVARFLEQSKKQFALQTTDSGLLFRIDRYGSGPRPTPDDFVTISYRATSPEADGEIPRLTAKNARVKVSDLMPGLAQGVQMLALDGAGLFLLPPGLSFGRGTWPEGVNPGTPLLFTVELHDVEPAASAP